MNAPAPYRGKEKYIFISYSHKDTAKVYPIISKLNMEGYRVWYDSGIDPGTEWDENIAQHIEECGYFIAFITENYLASNNCKDELNYVRDLEKERLIVYLENVTLPSGMAMRINRLQSIHKPAYSNENDFYEKLFLAKGIHVCYAGKLVSEPEAQPKVQPQVQPQVQPTRPIAGAETEKLKSAVNKAMQKQSTSREDCKLKSVAILLAIFLGFVGAHDFYLGYRVKGIIKIVLSFTPLILLSVLWGFVDAVLLLIGKTTTSAKGVPIR
jgi:TM2 domain-containing membrane protein YozV